MIIETERTGASSTGSLNFEKTTQLSDFPERDPEK